MYQSQRDVIFAEDILCKALSTLRWVIAATLQRYWLILNGAPSGFSVEFHIMQTVQ